MMGLYPQTIGKDLAHGFAGSYARQPDMIVNTRPAGAEIAFGLPLVYGTGGAVVPMGAGAAAAKFVGIAGRELKSSLDYLNQNAGAYAENEPVSVFQRGSINVVCQNGAPALGGAVYIRIAENASFPGAAVGGFEAAADGDNTVQLTNAQWGGPADANKVAELVLLARQSA